MNNKSEKQIGRLRNRFLCSAVTKHNFNLQVAAVSILTVIMGVLNPASANEILTLSGILNQDRTIGAPIQVLKIESTIRIPRGITLTIGPDIKIEAKGVANLFEIEGTLRFRGTQDRPIRISNIESTLFITTGENPRVELDRTIVSQNSGQLWKSTIGSNSTFLISNSEFVDNRFIYTTVEFSRDFQVSGSYFQNSGSFRIGSFAPNVRFENNTLAGGGNWIRIGPLSTSVQVVKNYFKTPSGTILSIQETNLQTFLNATENYWETTDVKKIGEYIFDRNDSLQVSSFVSIDNPLKEPPPLAPKESVAVREIGIAEAQAKAKLETKAKDAEERLRECISQAFNQRSSALTISLDAEIENYFRKAAEASCKAAASTGTTKVNYEQAAATYDRAAERLIENRIASAKAQAEAIARAEAEAKAKQEADTQAAIDNAKNSKIIEIAKLEGSYYQEITGCHSNGILASLQLQINQNWQDVAFTRGWIKLSETCFQPWTVYRSSPEQSLRWRLADRGGAWEVFSPIFNGNKVMAANSDTKSTSKDLKKTTITCTKGKSTLKVTGKKPKCPAGYKQKK